MMSDRPENAQFSERLRQARQHAGFARPVEAAREHGWNENTYKSRENGLRGIPAFSEVRKYSRAFKVPFIWLLAGEGVAPWDRTGHHPVPDNHIVLDREHLTTALTIVLEGESLGHDHARIISSVAVDCLAEPPLASLDFDPVLSFRTRYEIQAPRASQVSRQ